MSEELKNCEWPGCREKQETNSCAEHRLRMTIQPPYVRTEEWVVGSSLKGYVRIAPTKLRQLFGEPGPGDDYKVSGEYVFVGPNKREIFTIYDWKCTTLYEGEGWSPENLWESNHPIEFHVGSSNVEADDFIQWLKQLTS